MPGRAGHVPVRRLGAPQGVGDKPVATNATAKTRDATAHHGRHRRAREHDSNGSRKSTKRECTPRQAGQGTCMCGGQAPRAVATTATPRHSKSREGISLNLISTRAETGGFSRQGRVMLRQPRQQRHARSRHARSVDPSVFVTGAVTIQPGRLRSRRNRGGYDPDVKRRAGHVPVRRSGASSERASPTRTCFHHSRLLHIVSLLTAIKAYRQLGIFLGMSMCPRAPVFALPDY